MITKIAGTQVVERLIWLWGRTIRMQTTIRSARCWRSIDASVNNLPVQIYVRENIVS